MNACCFSISKSSNQSITEDEGSSWSKFVRQTNAVSRCGVKSRFTYKEYITIFICWHIANGYNYTNYMLCHIGINNRPPEIVNPSNGKRRT